MANKRQPNKITPQDRQQELIRVLVQNGQARALAKENEADLLAQIKRVRSESKLLESELLHLQKKTSYVSGSSRSPGRFKGRLPVPESFFEPLTDEELKALSGG